LSDIAARLTTAEEKQQDCRKECDGEFAEIDGRLDEHSKNLRDILMWWRGNGVRGAESRLREVEEAIRVKEESEMTITETQLAAIGEAAANRIKESARDRERTFVAKMKALAPIIVAAITTVGMLIVAFLK